MIKSFDSLLLVLIFLGYANLSSANLDTHTFKKDTKQIKQLKKRRPPLLSKISNKKFSRIHQLMTKKDKKQKQQAIDLLNQIIQSRSSKKFEKTKALWFLGMTWASLEKYKKSIEYFEKALSKNQLPYSQHLQTLLVLSQLHLTLENTNQAYQMLKKWFQLSTKPKPQAHILMASIYYLKKQKQQSLYEIKKACNMTKKPQKKWLSFLANLQLQMNQYQEAELTFQQLLNLYPSSSHHWKGLSSVQMSLKKTKKPLASFQIAHKFKPFTDKANLSQLTQLLSSEGIPYYSAKLWSSAIKEKKVKASQKNYEILGDLWMQARETEKSLTAYVTSSRLPHQNPKIFFKLGQIYLSQAQWSLAIQTMKKGLATESKDTTDLDRIYFQIGMAYNELKQYTQALDFFRKAESIEGNYDILARQFIRSIQSNL